MKTIENKKIRVTLTDEQYLTESIDIMTNEKLSEQKIRENILTYASRIVEARRLINSGEITEKTELNGKDKIAILCQFDQCKLLATGQFEFRDGYWQEKHEANQDIINDAMKSLSQFVNGTQIETLINEKRDSYLAAVNNEFCGVQKLANSTLFANVEEK